MKMMTNEDRQIVVAFDVDGTLITEEGFGNEKPRYSIINLLLIFHALGHIVFVWSGGGIDYAQRWVEKLGLQDKCKVIEKGSAKVDIAFDDCEASLGKVDVCVKKKLF